MAEIKRDNSADDIDLDAELTDSGRKGLAREEGKVSQRKFDLQDEEINVSAMELQLANEKVERKPVEPTEGEVSQRQVGLHGEDSNDEPEPSIVGRSNYVEQPEDYNPGKFEWSDPATDIIADGAFSGPAPIAVDLEESVDEDDWEEPEDGLDKGDRDDEEEDDDDEDDEED